MRVVWFAPTAHNAPMELWFPEASLRPPGVKASRKRPLDRPTGFDRALLLSLPAAPLVGLPVGQVEPSRLAIGPGAARCRQCVIIVAVEDQYDPLVALAIGRQRRVVDQEADVGAVRIALLDREND